MAGAPVPARSSSPGTAPVAAPAASSTGGFTHPPRPRKKKRR
jgi:hypothetical protein